MLKRITILIDLKKINTVYWGHSKLEYKAKCDTMSNYITENIITPERMSTVAGTGFRTSNSII